MIFANLAVLLLLAQAVEAPKPTISVLSEKDELVVVKVQWAISMADRNFEKAKVEYLQASIELEKAKAESKKSIVSIFAKYHCTSEDVDLSRCTLGESKSDKDGTKHLTITKAPITIEKK